jgi:hypothetical protein
MESNLWYKPIEITRALHRAGRKLSVYGTIGQMRPWLRTARVFLCVAGLMSALIGCRYADLRSGTEVTNATSFTDLWKTYTDCQTNDDPQMLIIDALQLNQASQIDQPDLPALLKPVKPLVSPPPSRLAVDPKAMASDCALRAAQAALTIGWNDVAIVLYQSVLPHSAGSEDNYYVRQARTGLAEAQLRQSLHLQQQPLSSYSQQSF